MAASSLLLASEVKQAFLSTNLASWSAFDGWAAGPRHFQLQFLVPQVGLLSWLQGFPEFSRGQDNAQGWLRGTPAPGSPAPGGGLRGTFLAAAETTCFGEPPRFSPALQRLPAYSLPWWSRNMRPDKLTSSKAELVHRCAPGWLLFGVQSAVRAFCQLVLKAVCVPEVLVWFPSHHPPGGLVTLLFEGVWADIPFVWLASVFSSVKW